MRLMRFQLQNGLLKAAIASLFLPLLCTAVAFGQSASSNRAQSCLAAARRALGSQAEVLKCGDLTENNVLETVAAIRIKRFPTTADGIPVSRLVVLRQVGRGWSCELAIDKDSMRNSFGYIEYLKGYPGTSNGFRVSFGRDKEISRTAFMVWLYFLSPTGENEGTAVDITWNAAVKRFQEFSYDGIQHGFQPEVKNPQPYQKPKGCNK